MPHILSNLLNLFSIIYTAFVSRGFRQNSWTWVGVQGFMHQNQSINGQQSIKAPQDHLFKKYGCTHRRIAIVYSASERIQCYCKFDDKWASTL